MLLGRERSICGERQKIIVSEENGRSHRALNQKHSYFVRQYRLDGDIVKHEKCCDFLVLNDSQKRAFFIELKGTSIKDAAQQLESAVIRFKNEIPSYKILLRIVGKNMRTHQLENTEIRKLKDKYGGRLEYKSGRMEEEL